MKIKDYIDNKINEEVKKRLDENKTLYKKWLNNEEGYRGLGSFQTYIFKAYQVADGINMKKLEKAYPEWFVDIK